MNFVNSQISPFFVSSIIFLQDEICRSISENGGIDAIFQFVDGSGEYNNNAVARACCSLLSKVLTTAILLIELLHCRY